MNELIGSGNIENDLMELEEYQQKLAYLDSPEITNYGNPEKIARAKEIANRAIEQINRKIRQKQNIQATVQNDIEAMNEAHKAKRQQERAEMNPVERGFNAIKDYSLKTPLLAGELASNIALGGGGFLARSAGNLTGWKGLETIGEKTMQANRDFKNLLDIENSLPSYFEGTTDHEWNSVGGATQNVIGGVGKFMEGYHEFAPLGLATSGVGAGIGMTGKALGYGEKAVKTAQTAANLGLFASSNVANTSDYIEQTSGKFKPIQSGVSSAASALAMEIAFALGRGRGMNDVEASNYATRMLNENQFVMMGKKAFKQSFTTAIANGFLNGGVGNWIREEFALPDNPTQEDYDRLASNVWEAIKHETAQGAIWGGFGAVQYHNEVRKLFNQLGGKKTITTPDGKKRSVYKTNASAKFILESSEKLQKEKFPNLFEKGSIEEVNTYLDELFKSVPEKLILGKSAEFGEQKENFKAALLREYNLAFVEYSSAFNSNNRFAPKIRNAKENKEAQTVNSLMANKVKGLYSQYVAAKTAIKNIDIEIEASKEDLQKQQELARQKEELQSKSYALTTQLEKPYSVYEMVGFIRNALEKQYGQMPEFMKRVDEVLSKYTSDNWHTPISADEAMGVYQQIATELSKLDTRSGVYNDYNSDIEDIISPKLIEKDNIIYGNDETNIPSSVKKDRQTSVKPDKQIVSNPMLEAPQSNEPPLLEYKPRMDMPSSVMDISEGSKQPTNTLDVGEKTNRESPSSFDIRNSNIIPKDIKSENVPPRNKMKIDSTDKIGNKAVRDSESFYIRADMPQSVMTDRTESPTIKNERGRMGLDVEMKQKEAVAPKTELKYTERDLKFKRLMNLMQHRGIVDDISKKELEELAKQAGFKSVYEILNSDIGDDIMPFVKISAKRLKSGKKSETDFWVTYNKKSEQQIKNERAEYQAEQSRKEQTEYQAELVKKYPILNDIDTNTKLWNAIENTNSKELQDILLAENAKRFEQARNSGNLEKWIKEREVFDNAKQSATKKSLDVEKLVESKDIEAKYAKFVDLVNEFKKNKNEKLSKQEVMKLAKEAGLTKAEFIDLVNKSKEIKNNKLYAESMEDWENWKPSKKVRQFILNYGKPEKTVKESRARNKVTNPVTDKDLNNFLKGQAKQITKETGLNFKVVDSVEELSKIAGEQLDAKTEGGIQGDTVYIVRGNVDKERFPLLIAHEVAGHRGVEALFDNAEQMDSFFKSLERASDRDRFISDAFAEVDRLGYTKNRSREAMAKIVERVKAESGTLKGTAKTFVNFITSRVRRLLRRMGFKNLQLNEAEVYDIAVQALRRTGLKNSNKFFGLDRFLAKDNSFLSATSAELDKKYPNWLKDQNSKTGEHKSQIPKTESTYRQIGEFLKKNGLEKAKILDASSGLGYGTEALREMGFNVEDIEMNPSKTKRKNNKQPTYKYVDYADIYKNHGKKYDVIINNAVLNVIPDDWRKSQLHAMADVLLNDGGKLFINVRDTKEIEDIKQKIELDSPREVLVTDKSGKKVDSYQRGFDQVELEHWLTKELGRGYTVEAVKESNSGLKKGTRAVVITKNSANANKTAKQVYDSITKRLSEKQLQNREKNNSAEPLSTLTTLQGSSIQRYKGNVGKEVNSQIYVHKDYAKEVVPNEILNKATQILAEKRPDFKYKTIMWDKDKGTVRFDEAPNFDTAPEPIPGLMVTVNPITGEVSDGYSQSIWHHKWEWVKDDYKGFDTRKSWERSREWLNGLANLNLDESDPYYLVAGKGAANGKALGYGAWNNQLMYYGLDHLIDDKNNFVPPESYRVAMERRQAAKAEKDAIKAAEKEAKLATKKREQLDKLAEKAGYTIKGVFHGGTVDGSFDTNRGEGGAFGKGAYFTNGWGAANEYAKVRGGQTKEYYLKMQKPFDSREPLKDSKELNRLFDILKQRYNMEDWELRRIKEYGAGELSKQLTKHAKKEELSKGFWKGGDLTNSLLRESGFDGIIAPLDDYIDTYQYVIFNPEQAKLADSKSFQNPKGEFLASRPRTREEARSPKEFYGEKRWNAIKSYKKNKGVVDNLLPTIDEEMYEGYEKLPDGIQAMQNITNNGELLADLDHALRYHYKSDIIDTLNHIKERVAQTYDKKFADKIAKRCDRIIRMTEKGEYDASKIKPISLKELEKQKIKEMPKTDWDLDREYYKENDLIDPVTQTGHGWVQRGDGSYEWLSSIGEKSTTENVAGKRKVKPNLTDELAQKIIDEVGEVRNPKDYNAVKKIAKENMAEYKDLFSTKKNTGYKTAALKLHYLTGYKMKNREVEKNFRAIKDFNVLKKTAGAYIRNIIDDKSAQANLLDKVVKANSFEKVYDIITNTNIAKEKELRQNTLNDFVENMKNLKAKKVSSATYEAVQDIIDKNFTREELDGLLNTNEFTTKAVSKLRDLADGIASGLGSISKTDVEVAQWAIDNARKLKKGLNNLIQKREEGSTALNVPVEKLAEVNTLLNRLYQQEKEARKALDTSLENAAVADKQKILAEAPEAKNPNSRDTYSLGTVKENLAPVTAVNSLTNDNVMAKMGKTMYKVAYENLLEGQNRQDHYRAEGYKVVDDIYQSFGKNGDLRDGMNNLNETAMQVKTSKGHTYDITKGEVLAAVATYMDSETRQIIDRAGGVDFFLGAKRDSDYFTLTTEKLKEMTESLTPLEKKALKKGSRLLSQVFLPAINETYERLNGVPLRIREDGVYFPRFHVNLDESIGNGIINRDSAPYLHQQMNADYQAMLKQRNSKARPSLMLKSFPEVLNSYVDQGALYIGMAEPLRHLNRVMTEGMKRELISRYGKEYVDRITTLTKNMAGMAGRTDADRGLSNRFLSNIAAAKLTPISALKQFSSVPLASSIIDFKYLAKAALSGLSNENIKEMMELDGMVLRYRNNGIAGIIPLNTKTWEGERQLQKHSNKWYNKIVDTGLNLSVEADKRALGIIYKATKLMAEAKGKGNDKAWIEKTFMDAVRRTQNTTDLASANGWQMKSRESAHWSFLNMYQNQTQKIGNEAVRLYRGMKEAEKQYGKDSAQYKEAKGRAVDFAIGVAVMNVMAIGTGAVAGSILHKKDEKETTRQKVADFATDTMFNLTGNPILKPVMGGSSYVLRKSLPKALGGSAQRTQSEMFGNDFTNLVPDTIYTAGKIFEEINSDDPAAKKFRKITGEALRSKSFENGLAMGRVPTWFLRYPSQLYRKYFVDESKKTKSASTGSSGLRKYPIKRQRRR